MSETNQEDQDFTQGVVYAAAWLCEAHGMSDIAQDLLSCSGYDKQKAVSAGCDEHDLSNIDRYGAWPQDEGEGENDE